MNATAADITKTSLEKFWVAKSRLKLPKLEPCRSSTTYRNIRAHCTPQTLLVRDHTNNATPNEKSRNSRPHPTGCTRNNVQVNAFCWIKHWYFLLCLGALLFWWDVGNRLLCLLCRSRRLWLSGVYCCVKTGVDSGVIFGDGDASWWSWWLRWCYLSRSPRVSCFH